MQTMSFIHRDSQSAFIAPPSTFTIKNGEGAQLSLDSPISRTLRNTIESYWNIRTTISALFCIGRPFHITFFIMTIIVFTVNRMFDTGAFSYFKVKFLKRSKSKFYTAFAITIIGRVVGIGTSLLCSVIGCVFRGVRLPVYKITYSSSFTTQASTGFCDALRQRTKGDQFMTAAIAATQPMSTIFYRIRRKRQQATKALICDIVTLSHCSKDSSFMNLVRGLRGLSNLSSPAFIIAQ